MEKTPALSLRLSPEAKRLLQLLAKKSGLSMTGVIELAIREKAKRDGVK
mgnify:FL=1